MAEMTKEEIKRLCQRINFYPQRKSGQNFLFKQEVIEKITKAADPLTGFSVLEIGAGFGFLTQELAKKARRVIAVELDKRMAQYLKDKFKEKKKIEVIRGDIFKINLNNYFRDLRYKLVSNPPYNISSLIIRNFLTLPPRPCEMVLTLQKELAERITASPGRMSLISVISQFYAEVDLLDEVPAENFWPQPEVNSRIVRFKGIGQKEFKVKEKAFIRLVKAGFSAKRKKLVNNLKNSLGILPNVSQKILRRMNLSLNIRAQELSLDDWLELYKNLFDLSK